MSADMNPTRALLAHDEPEEETLRRTTPEEEIATLRENLLKEREVASRRLDAIRSQDRDIATLSNRISEWARKLADEREAHATTKRDLADERHAHAATKRALARYQDRGEVNTGFGDGDAQLLAVETEDRRGLSEAVRGLKARVVELEAKLDEAYRAKLADGPARRGV